MWRVRSCGESVSRTYVRADRCVLTKCEDCKTSSRYLEVEVGFYYGFRIKVYLVLVHPTAFLNTSLNLRKS